MKTKLSKVLAEKGEFIYGETIVGKQIKEFYNIGDAIIMRVEENVPSTSFNRGGFVNYTKRVEGFAVSRSGVVIPNKKETIEIIQRLTGVKPPKKAKFMGDWLGIRQEFNIAYKKLLEQTN